MATKSSSNKSPKKPKPDKAAPAESYLTGSGQAADDDEQGYDDFDEAAQARFERKQAYKLKYKAEPLSLEPEKELREDVKRNRASIRRCMLDYIRNERRSATVAEIVEATGLSEKTVKSHKRHIKLGSGESNIYQVLSHDVIMSLYKKAKGFTTKGEKLITVAQGQFEPAQVERHEVAVYHSPDTGAAKLFFQLIEGFSEKSATEHSGTVGGSGGSFTFNYIAPSEPAADE